MSDSETSSTASEPVVPRYYSERQAFSFNTKALVELMAFVRMVKEKIAEMRGQLQKIPLEERIQAALDACRDTEFVSPRQLDEVLQQLIEINGSGSIIEYYSPYDELLNIRDHLYQFGDDSIYHLRMSYTAIKGLGEAGINTKSQLREVIDTSAAQSASDS